jgi:hypothetical protein
VAIGAARSEFLESEPAPWSVAGVESGFSSAAARGVPSPLPSVVGSEADFAFDDSPEPPDFWSGDSLSESE